MPAPIISTVAVTVWGPEPIGASQAVGLQGAWGEAASGAGAPGAIRVGPAGDPVWSFAGDLGPLQGDYTVLRTGRARGTVRKGAGTALPSTSGSGGIQTMLGAQGI